MTYPINGLLHNTQNNQVAQVTNGQLNTPLLVKSFTGDELRAAFTYNGASAGGKPGFIELIKAPFSDTGVGAQSMLLIKSILVEVRTADATVTYSAFNAKAMLQFSYEKQAYIGVPVPLAGFADTAFGQPSVFRNMQSPEIVSAAKAVDPGIPENAVFDTTKCLNRGIYVEFSSPVDVNVFAAGDSVVTFYIDYQLNDTKTTQYFWNNQSTS